MAPLSLGISSEMVSRRDHQPLLRPFFFHGLKKKKKAVKRENIIESTETAVGFTLR